MELLLCKIVGCAISCLVLHNIWSFMFHRLHLKIPETVGMELIQKSHLYRLKLRWILHLIFFIFSRQDAIYVLLISSQIECQNWDWGCSETAKWSWIWSESSSINDTKNDINSERNGMYFGSCWSPLVKLLFGKFIV